MASEHDNGVAEAESIQVMILHGHQRNWYTLASCIVRCREASCGPFSLKDDYTATCRSSVDMSKKCQMFEKTLQPQSWVTNVAHIQLRSRPFIFVFPQFPPLNPLLLHTIFVATITYKSMPLHPSSKVNDSEARRLLGSLLRRHGQRSRLSENIPDVERALDEPSVMQAKHQ